MDCITNGGLPLVSSDTQYQHPLQDSITNGGLPLVSNLWWSPTDTQYDFFPEMTSIPPTSTDYADDRSTVSTSN